MNDTEDRVTSMVVEMRAWELLRALRHAVNGAPHWRFEAYQLLLSIDNGELPDANEDH